MCDEPLPYPVEDEERIDTAVLGLLLGDHARPWSDDELAREVGDATAAADARSRLYGSGLVHRVAGFAFATRTALRAAQLLHWEAANDEGVRLPSPA